MNVHDSVLVADNDGGVVSYNDDNKGDNDNDDHDGEGTLLLRIPCSCTFCHAHKKRKSVSKLYLRARCVKLDAAWLYLFRPSLCIV